MFETPSREDVYKCVITEDTVTKREAPLLLSQGQALIPPGAAS